jgi:pimeloyl-ACP methyl ester carboxylesterase
LCYLKKINLINCVEIQNAKEIGESVADTIFAWRQQYNYTQVDLVGFSLGAQIAGETAKQVTAKSSDGYKVDSIVGLDPGKLSFVTGGLSDLKSGDAKFVAVAHCETNDFGSSTASGDVRFWVNGGKNQPGCIDLPLSEFFNIDLINLLKCLH